MTQRGGQLLVGVLCFLILSEALSETSNLDRSVEFGRMLIVLQRNHWPLGKEQPCIQQHNQQDGT